VIVVEVVMSLFREEMHHIRATAYLKAVQNALNKFLSKGAIYSCILLHELTGNHLQSQYVFVLKSFYDLLRQSMTTDFPEAIKNISESLVTVNRIEQFLLCDEITAQHTGTKESQDGITLEKLSAKWVSAPRDTLSEISFAAGAKELVTIVGPVGSGKTSLIKVLLQELPPQKGEILVKGRISYACQEPWLFGGTLKENILFGEALDKEKYIKVVKVCALEKDFDVLPYGDNSIVGDRGITLSGGQRARINLARAVYRNADIYILDDPLSAVDASVGRQLFDQCIRGSLQEKCVVLATHQVQYLDRSDKIYVLKNGKIVAEGNYQHIYNNCEDLAHKETEFEDSLDADSDQTLVQTGEDERFSETNNSGKISPKVYQQYLLSNGWWAFSVLILVFVLSQTVQSGADYFESFW
jgi:ATP-binding cassette subfamily C (CFTR/MRP) protein 4